MPGQVVRDRDITRLLPCGSASRVAVNIRGNLSGCEGPLSAHVVVRPVAPLQIGDVILGKMQAAS